MEDDIIIQELEALLSISDIEKLHGKESFSSIAQQPKYKLLELWNKRYPLEKRKDCFAKIENNFLKKISEFDEVAIAWFLKQKTNNMGKLPLSDIDAGLFLQVLSDIDSMSLYLNSINKLKSSKENKILILSNISELDIHANITEEKQLKENIKSWYKTLPIKSPSNYMNKEDVLRSIPYSWLNDFIYSNQDFETQAKIEADILNLLYELKDIHGNDENKTKKLKKLTQSLSDFIENNDFSPSKIFKMQMDSFYQANKNINTLKTINKTISSPSISPHCMNYLNPSAKVISVLLNDCFEYSYYDNNNIIKVLDYIMSNMSPTQKIPSKTIKSFFNNLIDYQDHFKIKTLSSLLKIPLLEKNISQFDSPMQFSLFDFLSFNNYINNDLDFYKPTANSKKNLNFILSSSIPQKIKNTFKAIHNINNISSLKGMEIIPCKKLTMREKNALRNHFFVDEEDIKKLENLINEWNVVVLNYTMKKDIQSGNKKTRQKKM